VNAGDVAAAAAAASLGVSVAWVVTRLRLASPPGLLMRANVSGRAVPAVLGDGVAAGGIVGLLGLLLLSDATTATREAAAAVAIVVVVMWGAGRADDLRGDERDRGFKGHLRAAVRGRLTGGLLKIAAGGLSGLVAGVITTHGWDVLLVGATVALAANLFNLLDRAPGRAGKLWLLVMLPVLVAGGETWLVPAAGMVGATVAVLPADLKERGMLGDAGANPLGAVWGLGLALTLPTSATIVALVVLVALNGASERWSFSAVIEKTTVLRTFDRLGRK
jgi:hypothetical protein